MCSRRPVDGGRNLLRLGPVGDAGYLVPQDKRLEGGAHEPALAIKEAEELALHVMHWQRISAVADV